MAGCGSAVVVGSSGSAVTTDSPDRVMPGSMGPVDGGTSVPASVAPGIVVVVSDPASRSVDAVDPPADGVAADAVVEVAAAGADVLAGAASLEHPPAISTITSTAVPSSTTHRIDTFVLGPRR